MDQIPPFLQFYPDGPLNPSESFSGATNSDLSNPAQVDVDSQFIPDYLVWERSLGSCAPEPEASTAQQHGLPSMPSSFHDHYGLHRNFGTGNSLQSSHQCDITADPSADHLRSPSAHPPDSLIHCQCIENASLQQARLSLMDRGYLFLENSDFFLPDSSSHNLRDGSGASGQHAPFLCHSTTALCTLSQGLDVDDAASNAYTQPSCNSKCASTMCENDNCSINGVPCDDPACFDDMYPATMPGLTDNRGSMQVNSGSGTLSRPHSQPCNHTESEHLVARTLGELRAPPGSQQSPPPISPDLIISRVGGQFYNEIPPLYTSPFQPSTESISSEPSEPQTPLQSISSPSHVCRWIVNPEAPEGERKICGLEFMNTAHFQTHLCESHSIKKSGQSGFPCLWDGCHRKPDCPFVTRGKLCRHLSTHSGYKPYVCDTCGQHFSGQQALAQHERIHTGLKPYRCTYPGCSMCFKQKSALTMHSRVHTGEKPLSCDICGKPFAESSNLAKHRKTHLGKLDHRCQFMINGKPCGKAFLRLDQLRRHQRCHLNPEKRRTGHSRKPSVMSSASEDLQLSHPEPPAPPVVAFEDII
ncbi:hypothetical protein GGR50DRAFT_45186 [Xylaria sp. CBS 124048]|nr:hypothetical protein GGR50DRAFT_45186 [Xylaria sp. CBS 124048]